MTGLLNNAVKRLRTHGLAGAVSAYYHMFRWSRARRDRSRECLIRTVQGSRMCLDLRRPGISEDLNKYGFREGEQLQLFRRTVRPGMCVLDIGGNIGYYALLAARLTGTEGRVQTVEPDPANCRLLERSVQLNGLESRVEVVEGAISDTDGERELFLAGVTNRHSFHNLGDDPGDDQTRPADEEPIRVRTYTLESFIERRQRPDYLRMDVEGHEVEILGSLADCATRLDWFPAVMFEVHDWHYRTQGRDIAQALRGLFALGYKAKWLVSKSEPAKEYASRSLKPVQTLRPVETTHGFYEDVNPETAIELIQADGQTKAAFLEKAA